MSNILAKKTYINANDNALKVAFKCPLDFKSEFKNSECSLTISVGQEYHEGNKLLATIISINKTFKCCHIMVCDTLQRHTMAITSNKPIDVLYEESLREGDHWVEKNRLFFSKFDIPYYLTRWNQWLNDPKFQIYQEKIFFQYENDDVFKLKMDITIEQFFTRLMKRRVGINFNYDEIYKHCLNYLVEECAVQLLWAEHPYDFEIYPNERNPILAYCYKKFVAPLNPYLLRPVALKFKKIQVEIS